MTKWIDVKEKMPDKDGRYLVVESYLPRWVGVSVFRRGMWQSSVTSHWMPLPELPIDNNKDKWEVDYYK